MTDIRKYMKEREALKNTEDTGRTTKSHGKKTLFLIAAAVAIVAAAVIVFLLIRRYKTYNDYTVEKTVAISGAGDCRFYEYAGYLLKYTGDGISYINGDKTIWSQPFEIKTPLIDICGDCVAICEAGGNKIYIYNKEGKMGELATQYPIVSLEVSRQGIVAAVTGNEGADYIEIYDKDGNMKVSGRSVLTGDGKPIDISISNDGTKLAVSYLYIDSGTVKTKLAFYNYSEVGKNEVNRLVGVFSHYGTSIAPKVEFISNSVVAVFGEDIFTIYSMKQKPAKRYETAVKDKIRIVFNSEKYAGMITRPESGEKYILTVYNESGKVKLRKDIEPVYTNAKFDGDNVVLYNRSGIEIISLAGVKKFKGSLKEETLDVMITDTRYRYLLVTGNGIREIRLK